MKKIHSLFFVLALFVGVILCFTACGNETPTTSGMTSETTQEPGRAESPYAFMNSDKFSEVKSDSYVATDDSVFRHDPDMKDQTDLFTPSLTADIPETVVLNGVEYTVGGMKAQSGRRGAFYLTGDNASQLAENALVYYDVVNGKFMGANNVPLAVKANLEQTDEGYLSFAKEVVSQYCDYIDFEEYQCTYIGHLLFLFVDSLMDTKQKL